MIALQLLLNSLIAAGLYAMLAIGFNLIYSTNKFFDIGYGAMTAVGGYITFWLSKRLGLPLPLGILAGILAAGIVGYLAYRLVYAQLSARKSSSMVFLVASLGVLTMLQAVLAIIFSSQFQALGAPSSSTLTIWGATITYTQVAIIITSLVVMTALALVLKKTSFGKSVRAIGDNEEVARIVGIDTKRVIGKVFFLGAAIGGLAGILWGLDTGIEPTMGLSLLLKAVIAAIIGGVGNVYAGVLGALLLGLCENFGIWYISGEWKDAIAFGLLIIFLVFRPKGILGK